MLRCRTLLSSPCLPVTDLDVGAHSWSVARSDDNWDLGHHVNTLYIYFLMWKKSNLKSVAYLIKYNINVIFCENIVLVWQEMIVISWQTTVIYTPNKRLGEQAIWFCKVKVLGQFLCYGCRPTSACTQTLYLSSSIYFNEYFDIYPSIK